MPQTIQRSFTSGEISPATQSRADLVKYSTGLNLCENFFVRAQGGVYSRAGFGFKGEQGDSSRRGRLIPFSFNTQQTYMLVFEHLKMRVMKNGGFVLNPDTSIFEIVTPYTESELSRLAYTQSADVMTIAHPNHDPSNLNRLADDNWTLVVINYASSVSPPTFPGSVTWGTYSIDNSNPCQIRTLQNHGFSTGNIISVSNVVGMTELNGRSFTITVTASNFFNLDDEDSTGYTPYISSGLVTKSGGITTIGTGFGTYNKTYSYVLTAIDADGVESLSSALVSIVSKSLSVTGGIRLTWNAVAGAVSYRVYKDPSINTQIYGWIGDSKNLTFDDYNIEPITSDTPPEDRQPFSGDGNKPATVSYYQQRQVFSNTNNESQVTFTTQTNNFNSLRTSNPARDDDAVTFTIAAQQVNEIRHIISLDSMLLLTSGGEWLVSEGQNKVLTPSTIGVRIQSYNGSSWVKPVVINSTALYLQQKNARIRDLNYEFSSDKYTGNDLSIFSEHLFSGHQIIEMAYSDEPYGILWCVRDDGVLLGLTYQREHQVWGWHQHTTNGFFESVAVISEDDRDAVYVIVRRTIGGQTKRYIERLEKREDKKSEDCFYVDSGLSYIGITAMISGATQTNPVVVTTLTAHNFSNGDNIGIKDVLGMTELNINGGYTIGNVTATSFELTGVDGTAFNSYTSGGIASKLATVLSGLDHLEGETVTILADGYVVGDEIVGTASANQVTSGSITLDRAAAKVHIGLSYLPVIELLDIDVASTTETTKAKSVSVSKVFIEVENTRGGFVGPRQDPENPFDIIFNEIKPRFETDGYNSIALKTYKQEVTIEPQWSKGGGIRIEQRSPLPMSILSVIPQVDLGGS